MITVFDQHGSHTLDVDDVNADSFHGARWIDLSMPTRAEETCIENVLELEIPTREEMQEIEISSRLYHESGALFMTATLVAYADSGSPLSTPVTFILRRDCLITVRYAEPSSIKMAAANYTQKPSLYPNSSRVLLLLLEALTDRLADLLEHVNDGLDGVSATIFSAAQTRQTKSSVNFKQVLITIGKHGDLVARIRESLTSITRLYSYVGEAERLPEFSQCREELAAIKTDLLSLTDHAGFLTNKISFLLDATLGMVNIEQNEIIKVMSVAATVFLPPTLIASAYGMNFDFMPELHWHWAYPIILGLMVLSGVLPYWFFKRKGWI